MDKTSGNLPTSYPLANFRNTVADGLIYGELTNGYIRRQMVEFRQSAASHRRRIRLREICRRLVCRQTFGRLTNQSATTIADGESVSKVLPIELSVGKDIDKWPDSDNRWLVTAGRFADG